MSAPLHLNNSGPDVVALQQALQAAGFSPGAIDGSFGPGTEAAVLAFQHSEGIAADGVVGPNDELVWQSTFGATTGGDLRADGNGDGVVDAGDYTIWRSHLAAAGGGATGAGAVPEPTAIQTLLVGSSLLITFLLLNELRNRSATTIPAASADCN